MEDTVVKYKKVLFSNKPLIPNNILMKLNLFTLDLIVSGVYKKFPNKIRIPKKNITRKLNCHPNFSPLTPPNETLKTGNIAIVANNNDNFPAASLFE